MDSLESDSERPAIGLVVPGIAREEDANGIPVLSNLVRALGARFDVTIVALRHPPEAGVFQAYGGQIHSRGGAHHHGLSRLPFLLRSVHEIIRLCRLKRIQLLHALWADEPGFSAAVAGRLLGLPTLLSYMGGELVGMRKISYGGQLSRLNPILTFFASQLADEITAGSNSMVELIRAGRSDLNPTYLPLGVDTDLFHPEPTNSKKVSLEGNLKLLSVASLSPVKNHAMLLDAFRQVVDWHPDVHLHIVGDGPVRPHLESRATLLGISKLVSFHGQIPHTELPAYYREADIFVLTSYFESQGMVILEAGACGCPVVGTRVGSIPELTPKVVDIPVGDVDALSRAILDLATNRELRLRLGAELMSAVREKYTFPRTIARFSDLYGELISTI